MKEPMAGGKTPKKVVTPSARRTGDTPAAKKTVVSQAMINKIKAEGMTAAIKKAAAGGAGSAYNEGVKRLYGASRVAKATAANMNAAAKPKAYGANNAPKYRPATSSSTKSTSTKKSGTTDPFAKFVFGAGKAAAQPFKSQPTKKK
jgi:hypothetical protein